jgi:hypothetical protein
LVATALIQSASQPLSSKSRSTNTPFLRLDERTILLLVT